MFIDYRVKGINNCPAQLLTNIMRYTPANDIIRMINGEKGITVFNNYNFYEYYKPMQYFSKIKRENRRSSFRKGI